MYLALENAEERSRILNADLQNIINWSVRWKVDFNPEKTELMTITSNRLPETRPLSFGNVALVEKLEHKHLGVIIHYIPTCMIYLHTHLPSSISHHHYQ